MGPGAATCKGFPGAQAEPTGRSPEHVLGTVEAYVQGPSGPRGDPVRQVTLRPSSQTKLLRVTEADDLPRSTQQSRVTPGFLGRRVALPARFDL